MCDRRSSRPERTAFAPFELKQIPIEAMLSLALYFGASV
jgi:hypothetical protein